MTKLIKNLDITHIQQPTLLATSAGIIYNLNPNFTKLTGWELSELEGQSVSLLVSGKLINKMKHEKLVKSYKLNQDSKLIGRPRVLPVKTSTDSEKFLELQLLPLGKNNDFAYLCFFSCPETLRSSEIDPSLLSKIIETLQEIGPEDDFRQNTPLNVRLVSFVTNWLSHEIYILVRFIKDNHHILEAWKMFEDYIVFEKIGRLSIFFEVLLKYVEQPLKSYVNLICLRIIFPQLCSLEDLELKERVVRFCKLVFQNISPENHGSSRKVMTFKENPKKEKKSSGNLYPILATSSNEQEVSS